MERNDGQWWPSFNNSVCVCTNIWAYVCLPVSVYMSVIFLACCRNLLSIVITIPEVIQKGEKFIWLTFLEIGNSKLGASCCVITWQKNRRASVF
jgi:hypothetical protein